MTMMRLSILALLLLISILTGACSQPDSRPNILLIFKDDQGCGTGCLFRMAAKAKTR